MGQSLTDSLNVGAFKGTICEDARTNCCTESDRDKCESEIKEVNSLKDSDKSQLQLNERNVDRMIGTPENIMMDIPMNHKIIGCARVNAQNGVMDYDFPFQPGPTPMNIEPPPNQG